MTVKEWRSLRRNRKCRYCAFACHKFINVPGQSIEWTECKAKDKDVHPRFPRWFCPLYMVKEDIL